MAIGSSEFNSYGPFGGGGMGFGGGGFGGFGGGWGGGIAPFGLFGLLGLGGLGRHDHGGCDGGGRSVGCAESIFNATVLSKLGVIEAGIPQAEAAINANTTAGVTAVRDTIQAQSMGQLAAISQLALAGQQGFSNLKDATQLQFGVTNANIGNLKDTVQIGIAAAAQNSSTLANLIQSEACSIKQAVNADGDMTRSLINQIDRDRLRDMLDEERHGRRSRETEINVTQTVNQNQAQAQAQQQQQQQFQAINENFHHLLCRLGHIEQFQKATASAIQFGTGNSATQTPTQNQVGGIG